MSDMTTRHDIELRLGELETQADYDEMNAERLDDADDPAGAQHLRDNASALRAQMEQLAAEHGIDLYEDNF